MKPSTLILAGVSAAFLTFAATAAAAQSGAPRRRSRRPAESSAA